MKHKQQQHIRFDRADGHLPEAETTHVIAIIMHDGILFAGLNEQAQVLTVRYSRPKAGVAYEDHEFIRNEIMDEPLLGFSDTRVFVFLEDMRQHPVPAKAIGYRWLPHMHFLLPNEQSEYYTVNEKIYLEYAYQPALSELIEQYIPDAKVIPFGAMMLQPQQGKAATVAITGNRFWISLMKHNELVGWHVGVYKNENDVAYCLLRLLQKHLFNINTPVHFLNCGEPNADFQQSFNSFFPNSQPAVEKELNQYGSWLPTIRLIQSAAQCVL